MSVEAPTAGSFAPLPFVAGAAVAAAGEAALVLRQGRAGSAERSPELCSDFAAPRGRSPPGRRTAGAVGDAEILRGLAAGEFRQ